MGAWRRFLGLPERTFSETPPRPIDQVILAMMGGPGAAVTVSRTEALSVPAVQRGRNLVCSIATLPLVQRGPDRRAVTNPLFAQIDPDVPNVVTLAQTVEDLLFDSVAWWRVTARGPDGFPTSARRIDPGTVSLNPPGGRSPAPLPSGLDPREAVVYVDGRAVPAAHMIRFDSPNPGILRVGGRAIRRALLLDAAAGMYADDPRPADYFSPAEGADPASDDDVRALLAAWKAARKERSTAYVPAALRYNTVDSPSPAELQLVELQRQASLEIALLFGVDPEDLGISTTSRTYANAIDRRQDRINTVLAPYMRALADRLSMGDVTKRGYTVAFRLDDYLKSNPTERWAVYTTQHDLFGDAVLPEIREAEGLPDIPADAPAPAPQPVAASAPAGMTFADSPARMTFDAGPDVTFSVDNEARTITGLFVPYGRSAKGFTFAPGSMQYAATSRVKLLRDHDTAQVIGRAIELTDSPEGLRGTVKVARGPAGDTALSLADDGVLDGFSVGVDFTAADTTPGKGSALVNRANLREVSLTAFPAFDDARVTAVTASLTEGASPVEPETETPAVVPAQFSMADLTAAITAALRPAETEDERPAVVNPVRVTASVSEPLPYRFDRGGRFAEAEHEFSTDVADMLKRGDADGTGTDAGKRVMAQIQARFAADPTVAADVSTLNPTIDRPDMYVGLRPYTTPLWNAVGKGSPPNGVNPFRFPKRSGSTIVVAAHTEGTEPEGKGITTTSQTVTPAAFSGKSSMTREVWDMGGNPAVSNLIWQEFTQSWFKGLETATGTFLNTLGAATDLVTLAAGDSGTTLTNKIEAGLSALAFVDGYSFDVAFVEQYLYAALTGATATDGRKVYPVVSPQNANGQATSRFGRIDVAGVPFVPAAGLGAGTAGASNNSWLIDPSTVWGWASAPQRLEFGGTNASGAYAPVAMVDIALWGYQAFANTDIGGVRQIAFDNAP